MGCDPRTEWLKLESLASPSFARYPFSKELLAVAEGKSATWL